VLSLTTQVSIRFCWLQGLSTQLVLLSSWNRCDPRGGLQKNLLVCQARDSSQGIRFVDGISGCCIIAGLSEDMEICPLVGGNVVV
jgi:hypothetical protein